ncbi:MAG: NADH-quinone oxidoreductase subunit J [Caldilineaceae bacterium]
MSLSLLFFIVIGAVSLAAAFGVVASRLPVHSALFLLVHFASLAVLYITLDAQFLAATQVIVYAGGIVILILFVIMLIGSEEIENQGGYRAWTPYVAMLLGIILVVALAYSIFGEYSVGAPLANIEGGAPVAVGYQLFTQYILPFELAAVLLLVALLGALLLARRPKLANKV